MSVVLIIEDEHDTRVTLRSALELEGFEVLSATNGVEGFELLKNVTSPVVVLLDQNMPLSSGDVFMQMRAEHPRLAHVPVIIASAVKNRVQAFGPSAYLSKPFDLEQLIAIVRKFSPANWMTQRTA